MARSISPISSRNSVPPSASRKLPARSAIGAGEGAARHGRTAGSPASSAGMAAQLTATKARPARASVAVDGARHDLLAGAGLAGEQHRGVAVGQPPDLLGDFAHRPPSCRSGRPPRPRRRRRLRRWPSGRQQARRAARRGRRGRSAWPDDRRRRAASPRSCWRPSAPRSAPRPAAASRRARSAAQHLEAVEAGHAQVEQDRHRRSARPRGRAPSRRRAPPAQCGRGRSAPRRGSRAARGRHRRSGWWAWAVRAGNGRHGRARHLRDQPA